MKLDHYSGKALLDFCEQLGIIHQPGNEERQSILDAVENQNQYLNRLFYDLLGCIPNTLVKKDSWTEWYSSDPDPNTCKQFIHQCIKISHGIFNPSNLKVSYEEVPDNLQVSYGAEKIGILISYNFGGKEYQELRFSYKNKKQYNGFAFHLVDLANQALSENDQQGRFLVIGLREDPENKVGPYFRMAVIFLTQDQREQVESEDLLYFIPNQKYTWEESRLDGFLDQLVEIGLVDGEAARKVGKQLREEGDLNIRTILSSFPGLIFCDYVHECYDHQEDYRIFLEGISAILPQSFGLEDIQISNPDANMDNPDFSISYRMGEKTFSGDYQYTGAVHVYDLVRFINKTLKECGCREKIIPISYSGEEYFILLAPEQITAIKKSKLFPINEL